MGIKDILTTTWTEKSQREVAFEVRAALESWTMTTEETHTKLQILFDTGKFNTIDPTIKATLLNWWGILKIAKQAIKDSPEINKTFDWRPPTEV